MESDHVQIKKNAEEKYNRMLDIGLRITDDFSSAHRLDVEQLRNLLIQISVVSFGAVGFSIPIIGYSSSLKNPLLFGIGLVLLLITALGGLWYSAKVIEDSIKSSLESYKRNKGEVDEAISNQVYLMQNPDKYGVFVEKVKIFADKIRANLSNVPNIERDKILYLLLSMLTIGIILVFLSLMPIHNNQNIGRDSLNFGFRSDHVIFLRKMH